MSDRLLRNALGSIVPNWLANRAGLNVGYTFLYAIALVGDCLLEAAWEGFQDALGIGDPSALPYIGQSRSLLQGPLEPNAAFVVRLTQWLKTARTLGSRATMAAQIQAFLTPASGPLPTIRIVDRSGNWVSIDPSGNVTFTTDTAWNWDSVSNPERANFWSDMWIIVAPSQFATYANTSDAAWVAGWGNYSGTALGWGHQVPRQYVDGILKIVGATKAAHTWIVAILWTSNAALLTPGSLGLAGNPDGTWGTWSKNVRQVQVPARTTAIPGGSGGGTLRIWEPSGGG